MQQLNSEYMTTSQVASNLGLSIGTVQKLVDDGQLDAVKTQGGHRRIHSKSFEKYKEAHGYRESDKMRDQICIIQHGHEFDEGLFHNLGLTSIRLISHPLELLDMEQDIDVLFIDSYNLWMQMIPISLLRSLQEKYAIYIYNCDKLPKNSALLQSQEANLIPGSINAEFIIGYLSGCTEKKHEKSEGLGR